MKTISTKSGKTLIFRPPQPNDLQALFKYAKAIEAEDTFILLNPQEPVTYQEEEKYLASILKAIKTNQKVHMLVIDGQKIVGACHVEKRGRRQGHVGIFGIALLKDYRSEGMGKQLAEYVISQAQQKLQLNQVMLDCLATNLIALKFYKSLGFTEYGRQPQAFFYKGKYVDKVLFYKHLQWSSTQLNN